jgi:hypothetical protein
VQEEIRFAVDWSLEAEALEPSATRVIVGNHQVNNWTAKPLHVRVDDARLFLDASFSIVLEDATSDRDFLLKMLTPEERAFIHKQLTQGFLRIEHGGGLSNMRRQLADRGQAPSSRYKTWVLFDSDSLRPEAPSKESELLRATCGDIPHHQLQRRFVESYLPAHALHAWAATGNARNVRRARFELINAFLQMRAEQRHHFNMKNGFAQDSKRTDASAGDLYAAVSATDHATLAQGFGERIGELFGTEYVTEQDLRADSGWSELRPAIVRLLAELR